MPVSRMRMRPWLEKMIESNSVSGLTWVDKDKKIFSIPWKHAARHGWEMDKDACLFKNWALHTGKYVDGQTCDPKTWKANFRCAMNSLPDIEEVKDKSVNKGHQAMRVYRMLPATRKTREKRSKAKRTKVLKQEEVDEEMDYSDAQSPIDQTRLCDDTSSTQENTVDSTVGTEPQGLPCLDPSVNSDWFLSVQVGPDVCPSSFGHRLEVSPDNTPYREDEYDDIIAICKKLEEDIPFCSSTLESSGFLNDDASTSPGSQWSEPSSADDLEDIPHYTMLFSDNRVETVWDSFAPFSNMH